MDPLSFPLYWEIILVLDWRMRGPSEQVRLQITIWGSFHDRKSLVPTTFVNGEYKHNVSMVFVGVRKLLCWAVCGRPAAVLLRQFHTLWILTFQYEKLSTFQIDWSCIDNFFPLGLSLPIVTWLVIVMKLLRLILSVMVVLSLPAAMMRLSVIVLPTWMVRSWVIRRSYATNNNS